MEKIIHFDISAEDVQRAKAFYETLFGWKIERFPYSPDEYYLIQTEAADEGPGIGGGISKRVEVEHGITNYIQVEDINKSLNKAVELGGEIISPKTKIATVGYVASCKDTEGNVFGLIELEEE